MTAGAHQGREGLGDRLRPPSERALLSGDFRAKPFGGRKAARDVVG
jgi:hypothetical protein